MLENWHLVAAGLGGTGSDGQSAGLAGVTYGFRTEYGRFGAQGFASIGPSFNVVGGGLFLKGSATVNFLPLIRTRLQPNVGLGVGYSFVGVAGSDAEGDGFNAVVTLGLDLLDEDRQGGMFSQLVLEFPTEGFGAGRTAPLVMLEVGFKLRRKGERTVTTEPRWLDDDLTTSDDLGSGGGEGSGSGTSGLGGVKGSESEGGERSGGEGSGVQVDIDACMLVVAKPIQFDLNANTPMLESVDVLKDVADALMGAREIAKVQVQAYTDERGARAHNRKLSQERGDSVIETLVDLGVERGRLEAVGFGEDHPVFPNAQTEEEHAKNRRVVFVIVDGPEQCLL
jgi:outer membrane protein OmpA-like peptidoglycan-associated protein